MEITVNTTFNTPNGVFMLLVVMVTTTLTLVLISHRLRDGLYWNRKDQTKYEDTVKKLKGIIVLTWIHLISIGFMTFRIMYSALNMEIISVLDSIIATIPFFVLFVFWVIYFCFWGGGNFNIDTYTEKQKIKGEQDKQKMKNQNQQSPAP